MSYTKGTWKAKRNPCDWVILVDDTDDTVADVYSCFTGTAEANSHLISASPDMYEALKDLIYTSTKLWDSVKPIKDSPVLKVTHPIIEKAKQAIAKAEGK